MRSASEEEPLMTYSEMKDLVAKDRIVVAYKGDLFDVTEFTGHPGGVGRLQMAAGGDLEIYWNVYTQHNRGHVVENVMAPYKIGRLSETDMAQITSETHYDDSAYHDDPPLMPELLTNTRYPYNAEGRLSSLTDSWQTPIGKHFVRNHSAVPVIDPEEYMLTVKGEGLTETTFTLDDLKKLPKYVVTTVIQCNGNRREDYHYYDGETPAFGPPHWVAGAIGNAKWSGPRLRDVLRAAGMDVDGISLRTTEAPAKAKQVGLLAYDADEVGNQYCCSFPFDKAVDPYGDVILAMQMNDVEIPRAHGYPVRCIVPGHAGARNCKYLQQVEVTDTPCSGHGNWKQYAVHAPDVPMRKIAEFEDYKKELIIDPAVQEMPVQSMITQPSAGEIISAIKNGDSTLLVKGVAWGGGGAGINRVDVSLDDGKSFTRASVLETPVEENRRGQWAWKFFEKRVPIPDEVRWKLQGGQPVDLTLTSKALNAAWNMQPENPTPNVNAHGCCVNHWYRVPVTICPKTKHNIKAEDGDFGNKPSGGRFATPFRNLDTPAQAAKKQENDFARPLLCTCGCACKPGEGCLKTRFSSSPSKLWEKKKSKGRAQPASQE
jgi:sulfite oxidase